jgi:hypothetical protein
MLFTSADRVARLWEVETGREVRRFEGHTGPIQGMAFIGNGSRIVTASNDQTARLWNAADGKELHKLVGHAGPINAVAVTADGRRILSAGSDATLRIWDVNSGQLLRTHESPGGPVQTVAVSADGRYAITGCGDAKIRIWDVDGGHLLRALDGHAGAVTGVALTQDGLFGLSCGADRTVRRWDLLLTTGLIANWKFDESEGRTAKDSSGNGLDGALEGNAAWVKDDTHGRVLRLDGINSFVSVANHPLLNPPCAITISTWINPDKWGGNFRILQKGPEDDQFRFLSEERLLRWEILRNRNRFVTTQLPEAGRWHHVAATYDSLAIRLFVDGKLAGEFDVHGNLPATNSALYIGTKRSGAPAGDYFAGLLSDVRLYDRALTAGEVEHLMTLTAKAAGAK